MYGNWFQNSHHVITFCEDICIFSIYQYANIFTAASIASLQFIFYSFLNYMYAVVSLRSSNTSLISAFQHLTSWQLWLWSMHWLSVHSSVHLCNMALTVTFIVLGCTLMVCHSSMFHAKKSSIFNFSIVLITVCHWLKPLYKEQHPMHIHPP